jgi:hypothetical protein
MRKGLYTYLVFIAVDGGIMKSKDEITTAIREVSCVLHGGDNDTKNTPEQHAATHTKI